jgi:aspartyl protease family protein
MTIMRFWMILLTVATCLAAMVAASPALNGKPMTAEVARDTFATTLALTLLIGGILRLLVRGQRNALIGASACIAALVAGITGYSARDDLHYAWRTLQGQVVPSLALSRTEGEVELRRGWDGHYRADAEVNGVPVRMMVDTGATMVLVPAELADDFGFDPARLDFSLPVATANGPSTVAPVRIASLRVGSIVLHEVDAAIARPGRLQYPLLGMSFLDRMSETSFRGDRLVLRHEGTDFDTLFISAPGRD